MRLPLGARHRGERMPRSAGSEGCCGAGRATPGHAVVASGCRRRTAPRDRRARTVRSPQHRLRGEQLWEQACRGSADSCETRRTIGRALAKKRRPRRLLREPQLGRCSGKHTRRRTVRSPNAVAATGVHGPPVRGFVTGCGAVGLNAKHAWTTQILQPSARKALRALNRGKICAPCMIRGARAAKSAPPWQDMRVVYPPAAICGAFRIHGAHILPKPACFGYMTAICCQGGALFPSGAPSGIHEAKKLPRMATRERIAAKSYRRRTLGDAIRAYLATTGRRGTHFASILPSPNCRERIANTRCHGAGLRGTHRGYALPCLAA